MEIARKWCERPTPGGNWRQKEIAPWMPLESGFGSGTPSPAQPCSRELFSRAVLVSEGSLPAPERSSRARSKSEAERRSECRESFSKLKRSILLH